MWSTKVKSIYLSKNAYFISFISWLNLFLCEVARLFKLPTASLFFSLDGTEIEDDYVLFALRFDKDTKFWLDIKVSCFKFPSGSCGKLSLFYEKIMFTRLAVNTVFSKCSEEKENKHARNLHTLISRRLYAKHWLLPDL